MLELTLRLDKGVALTHQEMDTNLKELAKVNLSPGIPCVGITDADKGKLVMFDDSDNLAKLYKRTPKSDGVKGVYVFAPKSTNINTYLHFNAYGLGVSINHNAPTMPTFIALLVDKLNNDYSQHFTASDNKDGTFTIEFLSAASNQYNNEIDFDVLHFDVNIKTAAKMKMPSMPHRMVLGVVAKVENNKVYCYDNTVLEVIAGEDINIPSNVAVADVENRVAPRLLFGDNGGVATTAKQAHFALDKMAFFGVPGVVGFALHSAKAGEKVLVRRLL